MDLLSEIDKKLNQKIPARYFLDRLRVNDESIRHSISYHDPRYMPFYYYLGELEKPKYLLEFGLGLGFASSCFLKACKSVEFFLTFNKKENYSYRLGKSNIKDVYKNPLYIYVGYATDEKFDQILVKFKWDLVIYNEEQQYDQNMYCWDVIWENMNKNGLMVIDYLSSNKESYMDFCKAKNKKPMIVNTRYKVGLIRKA